jgi:hypothetical protein
MVNNHNISEYEYIGFDQLSRNVQRIFKPYILDPGGTENTNIKSEFSKSFFTKTRIFIERFTPVTRDIKFYRSRA